MRLQFIACFKTKQNSNQAQFFDQTIILNCFTRCMYRRRKLILSSDIPIRDISILPYVKSQWSNINSQPTQPYPKLVCQKSKISIHHKNGRNRKTIDKKSTNCTRRGIYLTSEWCCRVNYHSHGSSYGWPLPNTETCHTHTDSSNVV